MSPPMAQPHGAVALHCRAQLKRTQHAHARKRKVLKMYSHRATTVHALFDHEIYNIYVYIGVGVACVAYVCVYMYIHIYV